MIGEQTNDAAALALRALGWMLGEDQRAARFLALTGLNPEALRDRIGEPALLSASLRFLEAFEPDLIACADAIGVAPGELVAARRTLER